MRTALAPRLFSYLIWRTPLGVTRSLAMSVSRHRSLVTMTVIAAPFCEPTGPSWACSLAKPLPWPKIGRSSPPSVTGVGTLPRLSWLVRLGCYAEVMTVTLHLDGAVAEALAAEAARRGQTADELAAALLAAQLPRAPRRRLAFAAVGASTSGRGAAEADEMLAEGFGRD